MLNTPTFEGLRDLGLTAMADGLSRQLETPNIEDLGFEERLGLLVDLEREARENRRLTRYLKEAHLRMGSTLEDVRAHASRGLDRGILLGFHQERWIREHSTILITGATGTGKSLLACALAHTACRMGYSARYYRTPRLLEDLSLLRVQGRWDRALTKLSRFDVLVLDDFGLGNLSPGQARDLLEVVDDRLDRRVTVVAAQLPVKEWHHTMGDPATADAILDRWVHGAIRFDLKGDSQRKLRATRSQSAETEPEPEPEASGGAPAYEPVPGAEA